MQVSRWAHCQRQVAFFFCYIAHQLIGLPPWIFQLMMTTWHHMDSLRWLPIYLFYENLSLKPSLGSHLKVLNQWHDYWAMCLVTAYLILSNWGDKSVEKKLKTGSANGQRTKMAYSYWFANISVVSQKEVKLALGLLRSGRSEMGALMSWPRIPPGQESDLLVSSTKVWSGFPTPGQWKLWSKRLGPTSNRVNPAYYRLTAVFETTRQTVVSGNMRLTAIFTKVCRLTAVLKTTGRRYFPESGGWRPFFLAF